MSDFGTFSATRFGHYKRELGHFFITESGSYSAFTPLLVARLGGVKSAVAHAGRLRRPRVAGVPFWWRLVRTPELIVLVSSPCPLRVLRGVSRDCRAGACSLLSAWLRFASFGAGVWKHRHRARGCIVPPIFSPPPSINPHHCSDRSEPAT